MIIKRKKYRSLRSILILWFVIFSIFPLVIVSWYSLVKFQKEIENEQLLRLKSNGREIEVIYADIYNKLKGDIEQLRYNPKFTYYLSTTEINTLKNINETAMTKGLNIKRALYDRDGRFLLESANQNNQITTVSASQGEKATLNREYLSLLYEKADAGIVDVNEKNEIELILFSKILNTKFKIIGYVEQKIPLTQDFLQKIKNRLKLEIILLGEKQKILLTTVENIQSSKNVFFDIDHLAEVKSKNNIFGFILYPISWGEANLKIAIGASRKQSLATIENINVAFLGIVAIVILLLIVTILISTSLLLKPINEVIEALSAFEKSDSLIQLKVKNKTELGLLTSAFNQMSLKIYQARKELKNKIKELEMANNNLKETQMKLVHSAKMTSLGQLVAGVAHELNNPIGFIHSNTSHLEEYAENLFKIIDEVEEKTKNIEDIKEKYDYKYIQKDLPLLIKSCRDGAQRARDIVIGLRNFSRLEEAQLKEISIVESIENTLELLQGEVKNRIQIHKIYSEMPHILCYASEINQVFMNVLSNAVQAINGNGHIWISTKWHKHEKQIQISIRDSGAGIDSKIVDKIFEPFFTTKDVGEGTGLGLSISYGIIKSHGGDIQVKSKLQQGTEFIITLPLVAKSKNLKLRQS